MSIALGSAISHVFLTNPESGGGGFTPIDIANLSLWLDFNDNTTLWQDEAKTVPVTADGQNVSVATDKSGLGHDYTRGEGIPIWETNSLNGLAGVYNSANKYLIGPKANVLSVSGEATGFAVWRGNIGAFQGPVWYMPGGGGSWYYAFGDGNIYEGFYISTRPAVAGGIIANQPYYTTARSSGANYIFRLNGTETYNAGETYVATTNSTLIMTGGNHYIGRVYEILIYDRSLTNDEILLVESYLSDKWVL